MALRLPSSLLLLLFLGDQSSIGPADAATGTCFEDRDELKYAIDVCFEGGVGDRDCHTQTETDEVECVKAKETYGWPMNDWCVGRVTDMHFLFVEKEDFNEDISGWDTSKVTDFYEMFSYAKSFDCDLSGWDSSQVKKMYGMFNGCVKFNGDISTWDTSSLEDMQWMFYGAEKFNVDLNKWDVSKVTNFWEAFELATSFSSDLSEWDTSSAIYMEGLFYGCTNFNSDISKWETGKVETMKQMFFDNKVFDQDISKWDLSSLEKADRMFNGATSFNQNLCAWRDNFSYGDADDIFLNSGCTFQDEPNFLNEGPFCASDCSGPDPVPTPSPVIAAEEVIELTDPVEDGMCSVCPGGLSVAPETAIPYAEANGVKCGQLVNELAPKKAATSNACTQMMDAKAICCPEALVTDKPSAAPITQAPIVATIKETPAPTPSPVIATVDETPSPVTPAPLPSGSRRFVGFSGGLVQMLVTSVVCNMIFI